MTDSKNNRLDNMEALTNAGAVCVVHQTDEGVRVMVYDRDNRSSLGTKIRTYLPGQVDGRWDGPLLTTKAAVLTHLGKSQEPCSVPVALAQSLFEWSIPFADLPGRQQTANTEDDYLHQAINHHYKTTGVQASESLSGCDHGDTESIVTLRNVNGDLAKYAFDKATDKMRPE